MTDKKRSDRLQEPDPDLILSKAALQRVGPDMPEDWSVELPDMWLVYQTVRNIIHC
jgi:hypothetical protein